nr:unnamed protein product [Callosobruchus chinensis]
MRPRNFFFSSQGGCSSYIKWYDHILSPGYLGPGMVMAW